MRSPHLKWRVVLVRPRNPLNIGAAARAMANFGLEDLAVVSPHEPVWQEARSAVGAEQVVKSARATEGLRDAVGDCTLAVGTTTGMRRALDRDLISLEEFPGWLAQRQERGRAALLFGSEKTGLSNEHLSYCHALVRIPTVRNCPSMNLGQAVAVCCYELARSGVLARGRPPARARLSEPASLESLEHFLERAIGVLDASGYFTLKGRTAQILKLRRVLFDLGLTSNDVRIIAGSIAQIEWKLGRIAGR